MIKQDLQKMIVSAVGGAITIAILASCASTSEQESVYQSSSVDSASVAPPPEVAQESRIVDDINQRERTKEFEASRQEIISRRVDPSMVFKHYGVNPTIDTVEENTTTFSVDVDTASYAISQGFLNRGQLPDPAAIRVEEFVNAFDYGYRAPKKELFGLQAEAFPSPFRRGFHVLHLGVKGADADSIEDKNTNLTFLIDVSGSMERGGRLEIVKRALRNLVEQLDRGNSISIVTYTDYATLVLAPTDVRFRRKIFSAIDGLVPKNSTNIQAGLELAYQVANKSYHPDVNNRIILCSDGVANSGETNPAQMLDRINDAAQRGIYLNTVGVGMGNYNDVILESLAKQGQGNYAYINSYHDAKKFFSDDLIASLQVLARDVRLQVEFDPGVIQSYRLLGYENRAMDNSDFNNARKDAGEVGVGHSVTAVYEIKFHAGAEANNFGVFRLAYKKTGREQLSELEKYLPMNIVATQIEHVSASSQLSYLAAAFAEKLRGSYWSRAYSYHQLEDRVFSLRREAPSIDQVKVLRTMIQRAESLDRRGDLYEGRVSLHQMSFDRVPVLQ